MTVRIRKKNKIASFLTWHTNASASVALRPPALCTRHPREMFHHPPSASCAPSPSRFILHSFAQWQWRRRGEREGEKGGCEGLMMLLTSEDEAGDPFFPFKEWNCGSTYTGQTCPLAVLGLSAEESLRMKWRWRSVKTWLLLRQLRTRGGV